ncbi:hypothetical protein [Xanthobacter sp. YC-JY1]|uniref:hypothetical protein n=1 Tax=Xanthobacter sp. YC-JY1 TaxID=2419844 RepID=UPI001F4266A4|nr:hypothetical protein [Xanthobacter sp. YC-JY1]
MAKRIAFEEILNQPLRWPRQGDEPFVSTNEPDDNAHIASDWFARLVYMMEGYKEAADRLVEAAELNPVDRHILVYPIVFNYRQFIELNLKYHIAVYGSSVGVGPIWNTHNLVQLWSHFANILEKYGTSDPDEADPVVMDVIAQFAKIDEQSFAFRYPLDNKGNEIPLTRSDLNLRTLADVMKALDSYFKGCDSYLSSARWKV